MLPQTWNISDKTVCRRTSQKCAAYEKTAIKPPVISSLAVPMWIFCFGSLVILDVACCYLWLFLLYITIKMYGKLLFTWLSLLIVSFCAVLFPTRCLGWDLGLNWVSFWGFSYLLFKIMVSNWKHCDVKIVQSESAGQHESGTDERIWKLGIDGMNIGYRWDYK